MAASLRRVVLVGGSGHLGPYLLKALQADAAFDVTVVSRHASAAAFPPKTTLIKVNEYTKDEFVRVFKGQDAVVLSLNFVAEQEHHNMLVDASIEAGVKRLIPSIWGGRIDLSGARDIFPLAAMKYGLLEYVKSKVGAPGWSYTAVANGLFHDLSVQTNFYGLDPGSHSVTMWDDGDSKFSVSTMDTIGLALTRILHEPEETMNRTVYISSMETTMNELLGAYKSATGVSDWKITHNTVEDGINDAREMFVNGQEMIKMRAMGRLGLLVGLKEDLGADFVAQGLSDNALLDLPANDVTDTVTHLLRGSITAALYKS